MQLFEEGGQVGIATPLGDLLCCEGSHPAEQIVDPVGAGHPAVFGQSLELQLDRGDDVGGEQFAKLTLAEEFPQEFPVERECSGPPLGQGSIGLVQVGGHEFEEQR